jgi:hypothetical protein
MLLGFSADAAPSGASRAPMDRTIFQLLTLHARGFRSFVTRDEAMAAMVRAAAKSLWTQVHYRAVRRRIAFEFAELRNQ